MNKIPAPGAVKGVEEIISELHERGVKSGREESERIVAEARAKAGQIVAQAEQEKERILTDGQREAARISAAARVEAEQMLETFMASLPDVFSRRASALLEGVVSQTFDTERRSETISSFIDFLDADKEQKLRQFFAAAKPESFLEGLLIMALAFYTDADGFDRFVLDGQLKPVWARLCGDPEIDINVKYEFRDGVTGFTVSGDRGREIVVSPDCVRLMAEAWAGEEFRDIYTALINKHATSEN